MWVVVEGRVGGVGVPSGFAVTRLKFNDVTR